MPGYAIVYLRPDGWWLAGDGFADEPAAQSAGEAHDWQGSQWRVVPANELATTLCAEALADVELD